jgi:WD40 repeat protein
VKSRALRWAVGVGVVLVAAAALRIAIALSAQVRPATTAPVATHGGDVFRDPIPEGATARLGTVRFRGKGPAVWAPDGEHLLVGGWNDEILGMSARTGLVDWTMPGHSEPIVRTPSMTDLEEVWRVVKRGRLREIDDSLEAMTLFPDAGRLLTQGRSMRVWDLATRAETRRIPLRGGDVSGAAVSPDGKLAAFPWIDCVRFVDLDAARERRMVRVGAGKNSVVCVAWSADGARVFAGLASGRVAIVPTAGDSTVSFPVSDRAIAALLVVDAGRTLWTLDRAGVATVRSLASSDVPPRRIDLVAADAGSAQRPWGALVASPDDRVVAAADGVSGVRFLDATTGAPVDRPSIEGASWPIGWSPDGRRFATWSGDAVRIVGDDAPPQPDTISGRVVATTWSPDGRFVATASAPWPWSDGLQICAWDPETGRRLWAVRDEASSWFASVAWSADGAEVVAASATRIVGLDAVTGARRWTYDVPAKKDVWPVLDVRGAGACWVDEERDLHFVELRGVAREVGVAHLATKPAAERPGGALLPDVAGAVLLENVPIQVHANGSWSSRARVRSWRVGASAPTASVDVPGLEVVAVSRDGRLAAAGGFGVIAVVDLAATSPRATRRIRIGSNEDRSRFVGCTAAAFSPDASSLALGDDRGVVHLHGPPELAETRTLRGHRAKITSLAYSDDGKRLVSGSADGTALVWRLP